MAQVQSLALSVLGKQMAVLGQDHLSVIFVSMSLAEVGGSAGVTSGQTNVVILGVQQSRWHLHPTGCHYLPLSSVPGIPCPWEQPGTGSAAAGS